jgi:hypothetical protein
LQKKSFTYEELCENTENVLKEIPQTQNFKTYTKTKCIMTKEFMKYVAYQLFVIKSTLGLKIVNGTLGVLSF